MAATTREDTLRDFADAMAGNLEEFEAVVEMMGAAVTRKYAEAVLRVMARHHCGEEHGEVTCVFRQADGQVGGAMTVPAACGAFAASFG